MLLKDVLAVEIARHQKVKEAPKFDQPVLNGSAREDEPVQSI
jgi:hypothetical protein